MAATIVLVLITALCLPSVFNSMMVGGWHKRDSKEPKIQELANFGVNTYNKQSNYINTFKLLDVISAKSQVIAGAKYKVTVEIGETDCRKNYSVSNGKAQICDPENAKVTKKLRCTFTIIEQLWLNRTELTKNSCAS